MEILEISMTEIRELPETSFRQVAFYFPCCGGPVSYLRQQIKVLRILVQLECAEWNTLNMYDISAGFRTPTKKFALPPFEYSRLRLRHG